MTGLRRFVFALIGIGLTLAVCEAIAWAGLRYLDAREMSRDYSWVRSPKFAEAVRKNAGDESATAYYGFDPDLGWTIRPNADVGRVNGISLGLSNSIGTRNSRDYAAAKPEGRVRISSFGDSFTHGSQIPNKFTWQEILEDHDPKLEVLNYGVPGYGLDQAYLRYLKEGVKMKPDVVLICYMSENLARNVNVYRGFYSQNPLDVEFKPRFLLKGDGVELLPCPISSRKDYERLLDPRFFEGIAEHDYWSGASVRRGPFKPALVALLEKIGRLAKGESVPVSTHQSLEDRILARSGGHLAYRTDSEAYQVTLRLLEKFYRDVESRGSKPVIVLFPDKPDLEAYDRSGARPRYYPMADRLKAEGYTVADCIDFLGPFVKKTGLFNVTQSHYKPSGNTAVAFYLDRFLRERRLI